MNTDQRILGIEQSGSSGSFVYTVVGPNGTNPAGATSPANRMANGKPTGAAGSTTTDNGAYNLGATNPVNAPALNTTNPNTGAAPTFSIPTENQWYKAAYYSPVKSGPTTPGYFLYGTGSFFTARAVTLLRATAGTARRPGTAALANKELANQANYRISNRYAVTGGTTTINDNSNQNLLTDVGAFTDTYSYYGAFDMSGNAWDWNDLDGVAGSSRGLRGGGWNNDASPLSSSYRNTLGPSGVGPNVGFRLVSPVPEPATLGMTSVGGLCACGWWILKRRRRART